LVIISIAVNKVVTTPLEVVTRGVNEMFLYGGPYGDANPPPSGPFVSKVEPGSSKGLLDVNLDDYLT